LGLVALQKDPIHPNNKSLLSRSQTSLKYIYDWLENEGLGLQQVLSLKSSLKNKYLNKSQIHVGFT